MESTNSNSNRWISLNKLTYMIFKKEMGGEDDDTIFGKEFCNNFWFSKDGVRQLSAMLHDKLG